MSVQRPALRWGVEQRLEFIEFQLFWEGGVNRGDIIKYFGVSVPQASKDLALYQEKAPGNLRYDRRKKRYFAADSFHPRFLKPDAEGYLSQLAAVTDEASRQQSWLTTPPAADSMPIPHRRVEIDVLRLVTAAIRKGQSVEVLYQSMNERRHEPIWRRMSPHAFGSDGMRWHARAYCHIDRRFKDFLLSRCLEARDLGLAEVDPAEDKQWMEFFKVVLKPNPNLGKNQRRVIELDYEMKNGSVEIPVRKALLYYFQKRLRLDVAGVLDNPRETPIVVANRAEFDAALNEQ